MRSRVNKQNAWWCQTTQRHTWIGSCSSCLTGCNNVVRSSGSSCITSCRWSSIDCPCNSVSIISWGLSHWSFGNLTRTENLPHAMILFHALITRNKNMLSLFSSIENNTKTVHIPLAGPKIAVKVEIMYLAVLYEWLRVLISGELKLSLLCAADLTNKNGLTNLDNVPRSCLSSESLSVDCFVP